MTTLFITGTDTDVGKTVVTACLAATAQSLGQSVVVYKPIQTGSPKGELACDLISVNSWLETPVEVVNTYCFEPPVTPAVADIDGMINLSVIQQQVAALEQHYDVVLIEGAGGVHVPVTTNPNTEIIDLIKLLDKPTVVVSRPNLGTINHTRLTVNALQNQQINVAGVIVSGYPKNSDELAVQTLPDMLTQFLTVPVLAYVPILTTAKLSNENSDFITCQTKLTRLINR